ncbi:MAG: transglycosylase SLT domain-containing protein [Candidatus Nanopelagicales bacterium]
MSKILAGALAAPLLLGSVAAVPVAADSTTTTATASATGQAKKASRTVAPSRSRAPYRFGSINYNKWYAKHYMAYKYGWGKKHYRALVKLWNHESGWNQRAHNGGSGAHGIPQALPGSKMASAGKNWRSNPETQIKWGLSYIKGRYHTPASAWNSWQHKGWY